ncbi:hypothetical protein MMPV_006705 [Pyropia vietnamensis]
MAPPPPLPRPPPLAIPPDLIRVVAEATPTVGAFRDDAAAAAAAAAMDARLGSLLAAAAAFMRHRRSTHLSVVDVAAALRHRSSAPVVGLPPPCSAHAPPGTGQVVGVGGTSGGGSGGGGGGGGGGGDGNSGGDGGDGDGGGGGEDGVAGDGDGCGGGGDRHFSPWRAIPAAGSGLWVAADPVVRLLVVAQMPVPPAAAPPTPSVGVDDVAAVPAGLLVSRARPWGGAGGGSGAGGGGTGGARGEGCLSARTRRALAAYYAAAVSALVSGEAHAVDAILEGVSTATTVRPALPALVRWVQAVVLSACREPPGGVVAATAAKDATAVAAAAAAATAAGTMSAGTARVNSTGGTPLLTPHSPGGDLRRTSHPPPTPDAEARLLVAVRLSCAILRRTPAGDADGLAVHLLPALLSAALAAAPAVRGPGWSRRDTAAAAVADAVRAIEGAAAVPPPPPPTAAAGASSTQARPAMPVKAAARARATATAAIAVATAGAPLAVAYGGVVTLSALGREAVRDGLLPALHGLLARLAAEWHRATVVGVLEVGAGGDAPGVGAGGDVPAVVGGAARASSRAAVTAVMTAIAGAARHAVAAVWAVAEAAAVDVDVTDGVPRGESTPRRKRPREEGDTSAAATTSGALPTAAAAPAPTAAAASAAASAATEGAPTAATAGAAAVPPPDAVATVHGGKRLRGLATDDASLPPASSPATATAAAASTASAAAAAATAATAVAGRRHRRRDRARQRLLALLVAHSDLFVEGPGL